MPPDRPASAEGTTLATPLAQTGLVTPRQAQLLAGLGLTNLGKLIAHLPMRHERLEAEGTIAQLVPGTIGSARAEVTAVRPVRGRAARLEAVLVDHTGRLDVAWFNGLYLIDKIRPGVALWVQGKVQQRGHQVQMINPKHRVVPPEEAAPAQATSGPVSAPRLRPVYPASEAITSAAIEKIIAKVLPVAMPLLEDHLPRSFIEARNMPSLRDAYAMLHAPRDEADVASGHRRLVYDELLLLQLGVHMRRARLRTRLRAPSLAITPAVRERIASRLPFVLTPAQQRVVEELLRDLACSTPTNRLIQGDVGSGKTVVALCGLLAAVACGQQGCVLAPTQILAEQHFATFSRLLAGSRVRLALLTGETPEADRTKLLAALARGELDILVGTHAVLGEGVRFARLALAVIDEQHRFGVHQRAALRAGATNEGANLTPHVVVMTATPIPRSLAMTLFGDLDVSTIDQLPPGRIPVATRVLPPTQRAIAYRDARQRIEQGQQAYVVVPAVQPGQADAAGQPLLDVASVRDMLSQGELAGVRLGILHGELPRAQRDETMERFRLGQLQALVATTVIEVGVDVPNASIMIVEQADRFGLSQLHQLRGRVGRGGTSAACYFIADLATPEGAQRLGVLESTTDGFVLAEHDLTLRGMGELFGTRQSGAAPFKLADPMRDRDLLNLARQDAAEWIARSAELEGPGEALLRRRLLKAHGAFLGLGDVG